MKIQKKSNHSKKITIVVVLLILLAAAGYGIYTFYSNSAPSQSTTKDQSSDNTSPDVAAPTDEQTEKPPSDVTTNNSSKPRGDDTKETPAPSETTANNLSVSLSSIQQHGSTLQIRTLINEVADEGTCTLTLEKDGKKITRSATIQALPSSSTCKGFDIDVTALATGKWNILVNVTAGSSKGTAKGTVTLK